MKVLVEVYDSCKYEAGSKKVGEARYDIEKFEVKQISDEEIFKMGFDEVDPHGEYLILTLVGGETSTFRNSLCDMFLDYVTEAQENGEATVKKVSDTHEGDSELNERSGQVVEVIRPITKDEADLFETGPTYRIRFADGTESDAFEDELVDAPKE